jgi:hypothetical protein
MFMRRGYWRNPLVIFFSVVAGIAFVIIALYGFTLAFQNLWNWLLPGLFGIKALEFWQAAGMMAFLMILGSLFRVFGGWRHAASGGHWHMQRRFRQWKHGEDWAGDEWNIKGGWRNWKYFDDWWVKEGKALFEKHIENNQEAKK